MKSIGEIVIEHFRFLFPDEAIHSGTLIEELGFEQRMGLNELQSKLEVDYPDCRVERILQYRRLGRFIWSLERQAGLRSFR